MSQYDKNKDYQYYLDDFKTKVIYSETDETETDEPMKFYSLIKLQSHKNKSDTIKENETISNFISRQGFLAGYKGKFKMFKYYGKNDYLIFWKGVSDIGEMNSIIKQMEKNRNMCLTEKEQNISQQ